MFQLMLLHRTELVPIISWVLELPNSAYSSAPKSVKPWPLAAGVLFLGGCLLLSSLILKIGMLFV
jgi:hypothetical protein